MPGPEAKTTAALPFSATRNYNKTSCFLLGQQGTDKATTLNWLKLLPVLSVEGF